MRRADRVENLQVRVIAPVRNLLNATARAVSVWIIIGWVVWSFLLIPYGVSAYQCRTPSPESTWLACLKSVAHELRHDSNLATYATATVAAAIALQLANRSRDTRARRTTDE